MSVYVATPTNTDFDVFTVADMQTCKIRVSAFSSIIIETGVVNPIKIFDCAYMQSACTCFANQLEEFTEFVNLVHMDLSKLLNGFVKVIK